MANTFKLKTFDGSTTAGNTDMTIYTVPASTTAVVIGLNLSNLITTDTVTADIKINNADGDNVFLVKNAPIPTGGALEVMSGNKINMETGDAVVVQSNTANSVDSTLSIMEIT
ncbi:hypothetical protein [Methanohalobium sp.]|uniref:hypothetical protein n=1 Tax=Methanohalobium sp. TaxID=2837493 RepID=UPI0025D5861A|nr:hypothetical protein [Methanohalobium sp.]